MLIGLCIGITPRAFVLAAPRRLRHPQEKQLLLFLESMFCPTASHACSLLALALAASFWPLDCSTRGLTCSSSSAI